MGRTLNSLLGLEIAGALAACSSANPSRLQEIQIRKANSITMPNFDTSDWKKHEVVDLENNVIRGEYFNPMTKERYMIVYEIALIYAIEGKTRNYVKGRKKYLATDENGNGIIENNEWRIFEEPKKENPPANTPLNFSYDDLS